MGSDLAYLTRALSGLSMQRLQISATLAGLAHQSWWKICPDSAQRWVKILKFLSGLLYETWKPILMGPTDK
jgi:hypothetical protein